MMESCELEAGNLREHDTGIRINKLPGYFRESQTAFRTQEIEAPYRIWR